jgi:hypothetical protein
MIIAPQNATPTMTTRAKSSELLIRIIGQPPTENPREVVAALPLTNRRNHPRSTVK